MGWETVGMGLGLGWDGLWGIDTDIYIYIYSCAAQLGSAYVW